MRKETISRIARHFVPNVGTILVVVALLWAQQAGALSFLSSTDSTSTTTISYQGRLADSTGSPITGIVSMTFRIYDVLSGGTALWTESFPSVQVNDGLFHVLLGSTNPLPINLFDQNQTLYLGITVASDNEMTPREQLASAPWAMSVTDGSITTAKIADGAVTLPKLDPNIPLVPPDGSITTAKLADGAVTSAKIAAGAVTTAGVADGAITNAKLGLGGVLLLDGAGGTVSADGGNTVVRHSSTTGNVRLLAGQSIWGFIDSDNSQTDASFRIYHNNGSVNPPVEVLLGLNESGDLWILGNYSSGAMVENNLQTSDELASERILLFSQGDLLCWDGDHGRLEKCTSQASPLVIAVASEKGKPIVLGAEPIKVLGPVSPGDLLVASKVPGYAVAWSQVGRGSPPVGTVIAKALEEFSGDKGMVKAMIGGY